MLPIRGFIVGFALGFGSGMVFRALAESDFEPLKDVLKTTVGVAQKVGDSAAETFGRLAETVEDLRSQLRADRVKPRKARERPRERTRPVRSKIKTRASAAHDKRKTGKRHTPRTKERVLHA